MEIGAILKHLPPRKDDKDKFNALAKIMTRATSNNSTAVERNLKRQQAENAAKMRELERESKLKGLTGIRSLAQNLLLPPRKEHLLNPKKRISAAIEAINNLEEFLIEIGYLESSMPYQTLKERDHYHGTKGANSLAELLELNPELNDALEYNASQALQHLERIRELDVAQFSKHFTTEYESLRAVRNYIEHRDPLLDFPGQSMTQTSGTKESQHIIASVIMKLIFEVGPDLLKMKEALEKPVTEEQSPLPPATSNSDSPKSEILLPGEIVATSFRLRLRLHPGYKRHAL